MKSVMIVASIILSFSLTTLAGDKHSKEGSGSEHHRASVSIDKNKATVSVNGMACEGCLNKIKEVAKGYSEVKTVDGDLKTKKVNIFFKPGKSLTKKQISELLGKADFTLDDA